jgi:hypothetical protein
MSWVIEHAEVGGANLLVLLMVANHTMSDGTRAFPSVPTLARESRMSERQVQRILRALVQAGHLEVTSKKRAGPKVYRIAGMRGDILSPAVVTPKGGGVTPRVPDGDVAVSPNPSVTVREPSSRAMDACAACHRRFGPGVTAAVVGRDPEDNLVSWCFDCEPSGRASNAPALQPSPAVAAGRV